MLMLTLPFRNSRQNVALQAALDQKGMQAALHSQLSLRCLVNWLNRKVHAESRSVIHLDLADFAVAVG